MTSKFEEYLPGGFACSTKPGGVYGVTYGIDLALRSGRTGCAGALSS